MSQAMSFLWKISSVVMGNKFEKHLVETNKIDDGPPACYKLKPECINLDNQPDEKCKLKKFTFGKRNPRHQHRTILLIGATGTGKSTLIDALVNFLMGVKFDDKVWFEIIADEKNRPQSDSQTSAVSVYEVFGFEGTAVPYSLTIIDTPGYGDTRGIEYDDIITNKLQDLFCVPDGVDTIDTVGLVLKASENRLDERMAYIFNSVTSLFGKNMEKNIVAMITYSNGMRPTDALQALEDAKIKYARDENYEPVYFLFDNCQKEKIGNEKNAERAARNAFETAALGLSAFTEFVGQCHPQSLKTTVQVMKERVRLTACIQNLKERITHIDVKQRAIQKNKEELLKYTNEIEQNQDFTFMVEEIYKVREDITASWDYKAVSCLECEETCHYPGCTWAKDSSWCHVMKGGNCTACSGKCAVKHHVREQWRYVTKTKNVQKTKAEMKAKYEENKTKSAGMCTLLENMEKEISNLQEDKNQNLDEAFGIIEELENIALNVDSALTIVHLDFLIEKMKEKGDAGKVQKLERIRGQIDERSKAGANYLMKSVSALKNLR